MNPWWQITWGDVVGVVCIQVVLFWILGPPTGAVGWSCYAAGTIAGWLGAGWLMWRWRSR